MQHPRRPTAEPGTRPGTRDRGRRPASWSRRMDEAREARAKLLAAREAAEAGEGREDGASQSEVSENLRDGPEVALAESEERLPRARRIHWRLATGFLLGSAAGAVIVAVMLSGNRDVPEPAIPPVGASVEMAPDATTDLPRAPEIAREAVTRPEPAAPNTARVPTPPEVSAADLAKDAARRAALTAQTPGESGSKEEQGPSNATLGSDVVVEEVEPAPAVLDAPLPDAPAEISGLADSDVAASIEDEALPTPPDAAENQADGAASETVPVPEVEPATPPRQARVASMERPPPPAPEEPVTAEAKEPEPPAAVLAAESTEVPAAEDGSASLGTGFLMVHAAPGVSSQQLDASLAALSGAGYAVQQTVRVDFRVTQTNIRYFHASDAGLAEGVAAVLSGVARDFTDYRPQPDPGMIEVWIAG